MTMDELEQWQANLRESLARQQAAALGPRNSRKKAATVFATIKALPQSEMVELAAMLHGEEFRGNLFWRLTGGAFVLLTREEFDKFEEYAMQNLLPKAVELHNRTNRRRQASRRDQTKKNMEEMKRLRSMKPATPWKKIWELIPGYESSQTQQEAYSKYWRKRSKT